MGAIGAIDFETEAIRPRPHYPPRPVGLALRSPSWRRGKYYAFGHPVENNSTEGEAKAALVAFMREHTVVCHHAGFDLDVAETHWGIKWPAAHHDTLLSGFIVDPDSASLSLKPLAVRWLGMNPDEQDRLKEWILDNVKEATPKTWGAFIARAPGKLVGEYAIGDVDRTLPLHRRFYKEVSSSAEMMTAYLRELRVTRTLVRMERRGIPARTAALKRDIEKYEGDLKALEAALLEKMKVKKALWEEFAWSGSNFAEQLVRSRLVKALPLTEKGNPSTSAESLAQVMPKDLAHEFEVRSQIATCLNTFMRPWVLQAEETGGLLFARFNQVRSADEFGKQVGARTGRLSMTPNMQNVIRGDKDARVPKLRTYVGLARRRGYSISRLIELDYSQQELRLLAHYEDGPFKAAYMRDPRQDAHIMVRNLIQEATGIVLERRPTKDLNFGIIYGQGVNLTASKLGVVKAEAKRLQQAHAKALPGVPELQKMLKDRARNKEPIFTWGGRRYYCEEPKVIKGRLWTFDYKLLNVLIQGSAADVTKQAMVNYDSLGDFADENPMLLQVHDSLLFGCASSNVKKVYEAADAAMRDIAGIEIPMLTDAKATTVSWGDMHEIPKSWVTT